MAAEQPICIQSVALRPSGIHFSLKESIPYSNHHLGHHIITPSADNSVLSLELLLGELQFLNDGGETCHASLKILTYN